MLILTNSSIVKHALFCRTFARHTTDTWNKQNGGFPTDVLWAAYELDIWRTSVHLDYICVPKLVAQSFGSGKERNVIFLILRPRLCLDHARITSCTTKKHWKNIIHLSVKLFFDRFLRKCVPSKDYIHASLPTGFCCCLPSECMTFEPVTLTGRIFSVICYIW